MNQLRPLRQKAGISQYKLGHRIGAYQSKVSAWEMEPGQVGYRRIPLDKAIAAAAVLGCFLTELRPDLRDAESIDVLLKGAPAALREEVRNYVMFRLGGAGRATEAVIPDRDKSGTDADFGARKRPGSRILRQIGIG